jgi:hypothetical protein
MRGIAATIPGIIATMIETIPNPPAIELNLSMF